MNDNSNRIRAFADVVSLDAWHDEFDGNPPRANLYADVRFGTARIGAEIDCPIRFRLSLKRAEIHLILPNGEPLRIDPSTVARSDPAEPRERSVLTETTLKTSNSSEIGAKASVPGGKRAKLSAKAKAKHEGKQATRERVEETKREYTLSVQCGVIDEGSYRWEVESNDGGPISGTAWDHKVPRATLLDTRENPHVWLEPGGARFEVKCLREDLIIEDIEFKDKNMIRKIQRGIKMRNREVAVIQYIRDELVKVGLETRSIQDKYDPFDKFSPFTMSSVVTKG